MKRLPSLPTLLLALMACVGTPGCSSLGDWLSNPGGSTTPSADSPENLTAEKPASARADILASDAQAQQMEDLAAALERLNTTQARLQVTLQDLQAGAAAQAEAARLTALELQAARRESGIALVVVVVCVLIVLLQAVVIVGQRAQVKRAARALARAEAEAEEQLESSVARAAPGSAKDSAATAARRHAEGTPTSGNAGSNIARLRKRPPVG